VLVLLPPSEGKRAPVSGAPVDVASLTFGPELAQRREKALRALVRMASGSCKRALENLGLSAGQSAEVDRDAALLDAPAGPAGEVYTGVLFQHLDLATLPPEAVARAHDHVLIASALWGVVGLDDRIPAYRLSISSRIPALTRSGLAAWWRPTLTSVLPDAPGDLVVDMRSGGYAAAWRPKSSTLVEVKASTAAGKPISHMAKAVRGSVTRDLLLSHNPITSPEDIATIAERGTDVGHVELTLPAKPGGAYTINVIATT
jgi:cytoplasmic iron level regulating protein YaaA (DUF328/UPF0246 family)